MSRAEEFKAYINEGYTYKRDYIVLGGAMLDGECQPDHLVKVPLRTLNRHGLIAGATGTGKTKSLQVMAEQLSEKGIPSLLMDLKGDLSGLAQPGESNDHIVWRHGAIGVPYEPIGLPIELMSISDEKGARLRATVTEFGPVLLGKILDLSDAQQGIIALIFKYCDDNRYPLLDLNDLKRMLQFCINEGKEDIESEYGRVSSASVSAIMRKIIELEQQDAEQFFGERSFDVNDLLRTKDGRGQIGIIRLTDMQSKPKLFSTFMLSLLAEIYANFPEAGDLKEPKLCIFIDEAHLIFDNASKALIDQIETIIKLIRSKAVGVYFCTQNPTDVPEDVLAQLGLKIQHALRAFTARDRKAIKQAAQNFPDTEYYEANKLITELGTGEALVTALNEKGIPTPLAATLMRAPITRMGVLTDREIDHVVEDSELVAKYNEEIDRRSAFEILNEKLERAEANQKEVKEKPVRKSTTTKAEPTFIEEMSKNTMVRQLGRTAIRELTRGLLGVLGIKKR